VDFIFSPDMSKLKPSAMLEALVSPSFTLSLGQGIMSLWKLHETGDDLPKTAFIVSSMVIVERFFVPLRLPILFTFNRPPQGGYGLSF